MDDVFLARARAHWTPERVAHVTGGKRVPIRPDEAPLLLRVLGLLNADGTMSADSLRKYSQVNHLVTLLQRPLEELAARHAVVHLVDAACNTSFVALASAWLLHERWKKPCRILGIDANPKVIETSRGRAERLGYGELCRFAVHTLDARALDDAWAETFGAGEPPGPEPAKAPRPHALLALHACDTATDEALALGIAARAELLAVAPCCQAELGRKWAALPAGVHALDPLFHTPNLRRDAAAVMTDALRLLLVRAAGYEVTATEFVPSAHTPKNRLLLALRRGRYLREAWQRYVAMKASLGDQGIRLEELLEAQGRLTEVAG